MLDGGIQVDGVYDAADLPSEWKNQGFIYVFGLQHGMRCQKVGHGRPPGDTKSEATCRHASSKMLIFPMYFDRNV